MKLMMLTNSELVEVENLNIMGEEKSCLFLGGLLHLSGLQLTDSLFDILTSSLPKLDNPAPIYIITLSQDGNFSNLAAQMHEVVASKNPTPEAIQIVDQFLLPDSKCEYWKSLGNARSSMDRYFSNFRLVAYSYGTSLVQQIETVIRSKLFRFNLPVDMLASVHALNIGPVMAPSVSIDGGNNISVLADNFYSALKSGSEVGRFHQVFLYKSHDKVMQDAIGKRLIPSADANIDMPYNVLSARHLTFVCENIGDEMVRRFGVGRFPRGTPDPRIDYSYDFEGHGLRMYTNVLSSKINQSLSTAFCVMPSSNLGSLMRLELERVFMESAQGNHLSRFSGVDIAKKDVQQVGKNFLDKMRLEFDNLLSEYRKLTFSDSVSYLTEEVERNTSVFNEVDWNNPFALYTSKNLVP